jgi:M6 family metalloprotease-like protein
MIRCLWVFLAACLVYTGSISAWATPHISGRHEPFIAKLGLPFHLRAPAQNRAAAFAPATYPTTVKVLFLRVDFPTDTEVTTTGTGVWTDPLYARNSDADYWANKNRLALINYYAEVSYGKLTLDITISPTIYRLPKTMAQYGGETPAHLENLIYDSVTVADASTDFTVYDAIMIIHAGVGEETDISNNTPGDIWSLHYVDTAINPNNSTPTPLIADGISITEALIMSQTGTQDGDTVDPLGIYAHEFGHWLGLPDLYDTSTAPTWDGVGTWGLMGGGIYTKGADGITGSSPAHLEAWSKAYLKWIVPQTFATDTDPGIQALAAAETNPTVFKLLASPTTSTQYYLLENRRKTDPNTGFDSGLPGEGLLVGLSMK